MNSNIHRKITAPLLVIVMSLCGLQIAEAKVKSTTRVVSADNPAFQPYEAFAPVQLSPGQATGMTTFTVPAGKRLVVEFVTLTVGLPPGQHVSFALINQHALTATQQGAFFGYDTFVVSQSLRFYAGPGTPNAAMFSNGVVVQVTRDNSIDFASFNASISGYLVDLPVL